jgi:hypothetical protein
VVSLIRDASQKAQMIHNAEVQQVEAEEVSADEMWSFVKKNNPEKIAMTTDTIVKITADKNIELPPEIQDQLTPGQQYKIYLSEDKIILEKVEKTLTWAELSQRIESQGEDPNQPSLEEIGQMVKEVRKAKKLK